MLFIVAIFVLMCAAFTERFEKLASFFAVMVFAWLASTLTLDHSFDTLAYFNFYSYAPSTHVFESGYLSLSYFAFTKGLSYFQFRTIVEFLAFFLFYIGIVRLSAHPAKFFLIYGFFPFLEDATQVRNFMMFSLVVFAYSFLNIKNIWRIFIVFLLLLSATSFQSTGYLYLFGLIFIFFTTDQIFIFARKTMYIVLSFSVFLLVSSNLSSISTIINKLSVFSNRADIADKLQIYATGGFYWASIILIVGYFLAFFIFTKISFQTDNNQKQKIFVILMFLGMLSVPFVLVSIGFERVLRNSIVIFFVLWSNIKHSEVRQNSDDQILSSMILKNKTSINISVGLVAFLMMLGAGYFNITSGHIGYFTGYILHLIR